jgi:histidinol-phosphate aminotransferase
MNKYSIPLFIILFFVLYLFFRKPEEKKEHFNDKKIIFISGSTSGIGKFFADYFQKNNYLVITHGRDNNKNNNHHINADISNIDDIQKIYDYIKNIGYLDIFINNFYDSNNKLDFEYQIKTNITNNILLVNKITELMKKNGKIIYISSGASKNIHNIDAFINIYTLVKNSMEIFNKMMSNKYYKNQIGFTNLKINNTYDTKLTKDFNLKKNDINDLSKCANFIENKPWDELTGRNFTSSKIINQEIGYNLDLNLENLNNEINDHIDYAPKILLGENIIGFSDNIKKLNIHNLESHKNCNNNLKLKNEIASKYNCNIENINLHNGILNFLSKIIRVFVKDSHEILCYDNSWGIFNRISHDCFVKNDFSKENKENNKQYCYYNEPDYDKMKNEINSFTRLIYFVGPLNKQKFEHFLNKIPSNIIIIVDFCYNDYVISDFNLKMHNCIQYKNPVIAINTFSKFYGLPTINISFSISNTEMKKIINVFFHYFVNPIIENIAIIALQDYQHQKNVIKFYKKEMNDIKNFFENKKIKIKIITPMFFIIYKKIDIPTELQNYIMVNDNKIYVNINNNEINQQIKNLF